VSVYVTFTQQTYNVLSRLHFVVKLK